jgi:predicted transcriptional regulator
MLLFYVTHPRKEIRGYATFIERITGDVYDLWSAYGHEASHKSYNAYLNFLQGRRKATFIRFRDLRELGAAVPVSTLSKITGKSRMPRSGTYISEEMAHTLLSEDNRLEEV